MPVPPTPSCGDLCLLTVHAHPDDEASKGAPTCALYAARGVRTVLVCCTGGEEGDVSNPRLLAPGQTFHGLDEAAVRAVLPRVRARELADAAEVIGFSRVAMLGYRDSGMAGSPANANPGCFHVADPDEAAGRLVALIREERPQVMITYSDDQSGYPHPDHLKVHHISLLAFDRAGDPLWYPHLGPPWQPQKLYYSVWTRRRLQAVHEAMLRLRGASPFSEGWLARMNDDHRVTTRIEVGESLWARTRALLAHQTQVDPASPFWFGLSDEELRQVYPFEDWMLARSHVPLAARAEGDYECDLFAGVRDSSGGGHESCRHRKLARVEVADHMDASWHMEETLSEETRAEVLALLDRLEVELGREPIDASFRRRIAHGRAGRHWLRRDCDGPTGYAFATPSAPPMVEAAGGGLDDGLVDALLDRHVSVDMWLRDDCPVPPFATVMRTLVFMEAPLPLEDIAPLPGITLRPFETGRDEGVWLELNNLSFGGHPEQGGWRHEDLTDRQREPWFDPSTLLMLESGEQLAATVWMREHVRGGDRYGEFLVVSVHPDFRGKRLSLAAMSRGGALLADRGLRKVTLYVDEANKRAVEVYRGLGFEAARRDRLVRLQR